MDKGAALNWRVWKLFENAGFQTEPSSSSAAEHEVTLAPGKRRPVDLYAALPALGVTIVGSNKAGAIDSSWTAHVNDYTEIGRKAGANKILFVVTAKDLSAEDITYGTSKGGTVWGEEQLRYYTAVADAIGSFAKYEILHALDIRTTEERDTHRVLAIRVPQPTTSSGIDLFMFTIAPERLLKTCVIYRRAQGNAAAYQRMLRANRLPRIRKFLSGANALLPTNILVHLGSKVTVDETDTHDFLDKDGRPITLSRPRHGALVALNIPMEYGSLELIDGQHRLFAFAGAEAATRAEFNLLVVGVKALEIAQRRDIFVAINDNARRMDANLVAYLKYTDDDAACQKDNELMGIRIVVDLNKTTPFKKAIRLLDVGEERITLKGFSGYDLRGLLGPRGLLRKYYPNNTPEEYVQALRTYFSTARSLFKKQWSDPERYIIATNRGISALLKLLKSILKTNRAPITHEVARKYLGALLVGWKTWEFARLQQTYVGSQGWKQFHRDLVIAIRKRYPKFRE